MIIKPGQYIHYKGSKYEVIGTATHSETEEELVVYRPLKGDSKLWVRPLKMWNDAVMFDGIPTKRFNHAEDVEPDISLPIGVHNYSKPDEKIEFFLSLFAGRGDVYAERKYNKKKGYFDYYPVCNNFWSASCLKKDGAKATCPKCPHKNYVGYDEIIVDKHLRGDLTAGVYPMFPDETCRFLAFDFDGKEYSQEKLLRDVSIIKDAAEEQSIDLAMERSRSGKGIHFWIFFSESMPASTARKFGSSLITYAMNLNHKLPFKTYDRMFPAQDTLREDGLGSLIALPLQKKPREEGNSLFVDADFVAYTDQWNYLYNVKKYSLKEVETLIRKLSPVGDLGVLHKDPESEKPWEAKKVKPGLTSQDFPTSVNIVRANMIYVEKAGISSPALNSLKRLAAFSNPEFYKKQAMRFSTYNIPRIVSCSDETDEYLCLPRGLEDEALSFLKDYRVDIAIKDETNKGRYIDVEFNGELLDEQQKSADVLLKHENGILAATTAFGKTVIGIYLIARMKINTLILVDRVYLLEQWIKRLGEFLIVNEVPEVEYTPKGRKRKKTPTGRIGGAKNNPSGIIDVAVMQSLVTRGEVKDIVKNYGMVIADECHHISAFSYEQIMKAVNAKHVYGLTATPIRSDGHHPITYMQCGKIRHRIDAIEQAELRPFDHFVIPRFTRFVKPAHRDSGKWDMHEVYSDIQNSDVRNSLIIQDVVEATGQGRNPIILTERVEHVRLIVSQLQPLIKNVIALTGGGSQKKSRENLEAIADIPNDEPFVIVATGRYIGEGFDMPRLDTLFLAMPVSWKGTVQQYAGRLHRIYDGKKEVQIYDYVDVRVEKLEKMYQKRLKGYAGIGYKAKGSPQAFEQAHSLFDSKTFFPTYSADVIESQHEVLIVSPYLSKRRIQSALGYLNTAIAQVTVVTRPPDSYGENSRQGIEGLVEMLKQSGITVKTKDRIHQKYAVIDQRIVWYGSINLLSYGASEESIMRIENIDIALELLEGL